MQNHPHRRVASAFVAFAAATSLAFTNQETTSDGFDHSHGTWSEVLSDHVRGGSFDYRALKKDPGKLETYVQTLHAVTPDQIASWTKDQRFAFWINAYNAHTIQKVIENYPLDSIRDLNKMFGLKSIFDNEFIEMRAHHPDGKKDELSLNDIENGILRESFKDARLHAAINCASVSCPNLRNEAFVADELDVQLEEQMRAFVADESKNRLDRKKGRVRISEIFKWFKGDFERDADGVRAYIARFSPEADREFIREARIDYIGYDWDLNDVAEE